MVKAPIFATLSWKQSFYLKKKLIPIENWKIGLCEKPYFFYAYLKLPNDVERLSERLSSLDYNSFISLKERIWRTSLELKLELSFV